MTPGPSDREQAADSLADRLTAHLRERPGEPLLLQGKGVSATPHVERRLFELLERAGEEHEGPVALTALSNVRPELNPFAGLGAGLEETPATGLLEGLVALLAPGLLIEWHRWPDHICCLSAGAVEALARPDTTAANAVGRLRDIGGSMLLADSVFLHHQGSGLFRDESLAPHEARRPAAWGLLRERLDGWLELAKRSGRVPAAAAIEDYRAAEKKVSLHITHSWGGGVEQWVHSFIEADSEGLNLQLRAEGPRTGAGCGQRLSLYLDRQVEAPVASWWLQPPILSTEAESGQYRRILNEIVARFGVGRVIVSSLVGHSLDALASGLPTIEVLHDFYPMWPLLGIHPGPYLEEGRPVRLEQALAEHELMPELQDLDAAGWRALGERWLETVTRRAVHAIAPSRSVAEMLPRLNPDWAGVAVETVPHGLPEIPGSAEVVPRDRADGRLRLLIPGRMHEGKGQALLLEALPQLRPHARICLLGAGRNAEAFFGQADVDVIIDYRREDLRELLASIGPQVAALLSTVPETFSYTLSEMQQLNIPVIATRVGSLAERIEDGETGWLIDPEPEALVRAVRSAEFRPDGCQLWRHLPARPHRP
jgi:glycosyltransferase involved in cell wall biosynthesis